MTGHVAALQTDSLSADPSCSQMMGGAAAAEHIQYFTSYTQSYELFNYYSHTKNLNEVICMLHYVNSR